MSLGATGLGALTGLAIGGNGRSAALGAALGYVASKVQRKEPLFSGGIEHQIDGGKVHRKKRSLSRKRKILKSPKKHKRKSPKKNKNLKSI
jgi:hypothetical protein